jgi:hypothetical protein
MLAELLQETWGGMDAALKVRLRDEVRHVLVNLKVAQATIDKTTETCDAVLRHLYARLLQNAAKRAAETDQSKAIEVDGLLDDPLKIQHRAGHTDFETTQRYIRMAESLREGFGSPFPELPASLTKSHADIARAF